MAKKAKKNPPKPKTLHTKPLPTCKKWTRSRAAADEGKKKVTGKFISMYRSGPMIGSVKLGHLYLHAILSFIEVVDLAESSLSQEEVDEENCKVVGKPTCSRGWRKGRRRG